MLWDDYVVRYGDGRTLNVLDHGFLDWGITGVPESFLVDPAGVVRAKVVGGVTEAGLERLLATARGA